jgi:hypothetical protein
LVRIFHVF